MITKIERGKITVTQYGLPPGEYGIADCTAEQLLVERRILSTYMQQHPQLIHLFDKLDGQLSKIIDRKCQE